MEFTFTQLRYPGNELIVLCMHSTPADRTEQFNRKVDWITKRFTPLHPDQLPDYFSGKLSNGPYVLFTFDDGLKNNLHAARALANRSIGAVFFIVPKFIEAQDGHRYYTQYIRPIVDRKVDHEAEDTLPMDRDELEALVQMGHRIESHTLTHRMNLAMASDELDDEINGSADWITKQLNLNVNAFCSPNNTLFSVGTVAKQKIAERYAYHYTTLPGLNAIEQNPQFICRRNIEVHWPMGKVLFALGKWDLARWRRHAKAYKMR